MDRTLVLYAGTFGHGIFKSVNGGGIWIRSRIGLNPVGASTSIPSPSIPWSRRLSTPGPASTRTPVTADLAVVNTVGMRLLTRLLGSTTGRSILHHLVTALIRPS
jgi:hypothetical protein